MKCASALSTATSSADAFAEIVGRVSEGLGGETATIALAFVSPHHRDALATLASIGRDRGLSSHILGTTGEAIIGDGREVEGEPAASLWAIQLPDRVVARPVHLTWGEKPSLPPDMKTWGQARRTILLLGDPFSYPADQLFQMIEKEAPGLWVVGGMASGSSRPGGNRLLLDGDVHTEGAVGLAIDGPLEVRTVVSQGCRPIGRTWIITRAEGNIIRELGRRRALDVLREMFESLSDEEQALVREGLHIGRVINEYQGSFERGDFLIRNVMGADDAGGIAITDAVKVGQTVQFHVRDARTADEDLGTLLERDRDLNALARIAGGLLFSCNGRGSRLFPIPNHDAHAVHRTYGAIPMAGFFAMGEFGPVGGKNFVHGFTASLALFATDQPGARDA